MGNLTRQDYIVKLLMQKKKMSVEELASILSVTPTTIRRDLLILEEKHQIVRTRGFALFNENFQKDYDGHLRTELFYNEKQRIAGKALELVSSHSSIFLDSGTTILEFAKELNQCTDLEDINIVTNAIDVAQSLFNVNQIFMPGGVLHHYSKVLFGIDTASYFKDINADIAFMGTNGLLNCPGLTVSIPFFLDIKRNMIRSASKGVALADSSKFMCRGIYTYCEYSEVDVLITVQTPENEAALDRIRNSNPGIDIILA